MEPNLATWLDQSRFEDWQKQLFEVMYEDFQEYFDTAKEEIAEYYGN